jgi:hypothetical protein
MAQDTYEFEGLDDDLSRPPLAALRALHVAGVVFSPRAWEDVPVQTRHALTHIGAQDSFDEAWRRTGAQGVFPPKHVRITSPIADPDGLKVPVVLDRALSAGRSLPLSFWQAIRPLDRRVLVMLATNRRLFNRALEEISVIHRLPLLALAATEDTVTVGHCEVHLPQAAGDALQELTVLDGQAYLLARIAGIRAARSASLILGLHGDTATGVVEIGSDIRRITNNTLVVWQAHVSTVEGAFFPAASLLGATTAAAALLDIVATETNTSAAIVGATIADEPWRIAEIEDAHTIALPALDR